MVTLKQKVMFKLIKKTEWQSVSGVTGYTLVVAYKGRVFTITSGDFENLEISTANNTVILGETPVIVKNNYIDALGNTRVGLSLKPKCDIELSVI